MGVPYVSSKKLTHKLSMLWVPLVLQLAVVRSAVITFTGDAATDFNTADSFTLPDPHDIFPNSGIDVLAIHFSYDEASDTGYFGESVAV